MSHGIDLQWAILQHLPRLPAKITASEMLAKLESAGYRTSKRTIERDLQKLSRIFPLDADERSKPFGWSWAKGAESMSLPGMDPQTALAFVAAESFLRPLLPRPTLDYLAPHFAHAKSTLAAQPQTFGSWKDKVRALPRGFRLQMPKVAADVEAAVSRALLENRVLDIHYRGRNDETPKHLSDVHPLALVYRDPVVYLVCTMWDYAEPRQLLLHRMVSAAVLEHAAQAMQSFDIDSYIAAGEFGFPIGPEICLDAVFDPSAAAHLYETPVALDQSLKVRRDGRVHVRATVQHTEELIWWLRGFGDLVEVKTPDIS